MNVTIPIEKLGEHAGRAQGRVVVITGELIVRGVNSDALTSWIRHRRSQRYRKGYCSPVCPIRVRWFVLRPLLCATILRRSKVVIADVNDKLGHEVREGILAHGR
jgi:hypothetical protein